MPLKNAESVEHVCGHHCRTCWSGTSENNTFRHSASQWRHSRAHCSLRRWWSLDNGSRRNDMRATSPDLKTWLRTVEADRSKPVAVVQRRFNNVDEAVWSDMPCTSHNVTVWQTCLPETNHSAPFVCTHLLIFRPFTSTRHTCTGFHVSPLFGSSALTEQGITLTLLVTQEISP